MKYLLFAIINAVYGVLLFLTLSSSTPGYTIIFSIAAILTILGVTGFVLWVRSMINSNPDQPASNELLNSWYQLVKSFDTVLILGLMFRAFIIQPFIVEGDSMSPNFHNNEALLVDKVTYRLRSPERGEVIVFKAPPKPEDDYIKRIIALPGETVVIDNGSVKVNNQTLTEVYLPANLKTATVNDNGTVPFTLTLGPNQYFVLGDNRGNSSDSREWGPVDRGSIIGRPVLTVFPLNEFHLIKTPLLGFKSN